MSRRLRVHESGFTQRARSSLRNINYSLNAIFEQKDVEVDKQSEWLIGSVNMSAIVFYEPAELPPPTSAR